MFQYAGEVSSTVTTYNGGPIRRDLPTRVRDLYPSDSSGPVPLDPYVPPDALQRLTVRNAAIYFARVVRSRAGRLARKSRVLNGRFRRAIAFYYAKSAYRYRRARVYTVISLRTCKTCDAIPSESVL